MGDKVEVPSDVVKVGVGNDGENVVIIKLIDFLVKVGSGGEI